jgi:hypothetical protein
LIISLPRFNEGYGHNQSECCGTRSRLELARYSKEWYIRNR